MAVPVLGIIYGLRGPFVCHLIIAIDCVRRVAGVVSSMSLSVIRCMHAFAVPTAKGHLCCCESLQWDRQQQQTENDRFQRWHARFLDTGKR